MSDSIMYNLVRFPDGQSSVTAFINGQPYSVSGNHESFDRIIDKLRVGDASVVNDFDRANLANKAFHAVTNRVSVRQGVVYLDDKPVEADFNKVIVEYLIEGNENALPLVKFLERLDANPSHRSRTQFGRFVRENDIHVDDEGFVILYKGVYSTEKAGVYRSSARGVAFVNGERQEGHIHSAVGDTVSMPRREISDDPSVACHAGLHAGARSYAQSFAPVLITVRVDPAHVVSVPTDSSNRKVRVEQYEIMDVVSGDRNSVRWEGAGNTLSDEDDEPEADYDDTPFWQRY